MLVFSIKRRKCEIQLVYIGIYPNNGVHLMQFGCNLIQSFIASVKGIWKFIAIEMKFHFGKIPAVDFVI